MARPRVRRPDRAIAGSARRIDLARPALADKQVKAQADWVEDAWAFYDGSSTVKFGIQWLGNAVSKVTLYLAAVDPADPSNVSGVRDEDGNPRPDVPLGAIIGGEEQIRRLAGETGGTGDILRVLTMQLEVAAEGYLVGYGERPLVLPDLLNGVEGTPAEPESWEARSTDEVWSEGGVIRVGDGRSDAAARTLDPVLDDAIRLWQRHPRRREWADGMLKALRVDLLALDTYVKLRLAEGNSRRPAGILLMPNEIHVVGHDGDTGDGGDTADAILDALEDAFSEAIEDPQNPESVMPVLLKGPAIALPAVRHLELSRTADAALDDRIEKLVNGIARGMNVPVEVIMGHMSCVDHETELLSARGWLGVDDVAEGDTILTLNHGTGLSEWQQVRFVHRSPVVDHPMVALDGQSHHSLSTTDHRWPVVTQRGKRRWYESATLNTNCRIVVAAPNADAPAEPKWSDGFVEVVAWFYTEGTFHGTGGGTIFQNEGEHAAAIRGALTALCGPARASLHQAGRSGEWAWRESAAAGTCRFHLSKPLTDAVRVVAPGKVPSIDFFRSLTVAQRDLFVARSVDGDGWRHPNGTTLQFHQVDQARAEAFEVACLLSGRGVTERYIAPGDAGSTYKGSERHQILAGDRPPSRIGFGIQKTETLYTGEVWCPNVPNGTFLARRRGSVFFTGNTTFSNAEQIDEDVFDDHIEPRLTFLVDALTEHWLRPLLVEAWGVPEADARRVRVWFDPSALLSKPDRTVDATEALDKGLISGTAWRAAKGWGEQDAPSPEERIINTAFSKGIFTGDLFAAALKAGGFPLDIILPSAPGMAQPETPDAPAPAPVPVPVPVEAPTEPMEAPPAEAALVAAGRRRRPLGERLAAADRELRARVVTAADREMVRALEKAGGRIRKKLTASTRPLVAAVPNVGVAARLGRALVADVVGPDVLDGAWDDLASAFERQVAAAQANALAWTTTSLALDPAVVSAVEAQQALDAAAALDWFIDSMGTVATDLMFDPVAAVPLLGEWEAGVRVPVGLVRHALALAGGGNGLVDGPGAWVALAAGGTRPIGGVGTGELLRATVLDAGGRVEAYRWDYGVSSNHFEPHQRLDGEHFEAFDDPVLSTHGASFPGGAFYLPGDHRGCSCDVTPVVLNANGDEV